MSDLDDDIDRLYQGPLDAFTDARNALAKSAKRPDVKTLVKPSLPAWAVNQLHWRHRALVDRLEAASDAVRAAHQQALAGGTADIAAAERTHREVRREAAGVAKDELTAAGHPATPATLEAIRETLSALPSPEANGRLTKPLAARGLEALAGLVLAARVPGPVAARTPTAAAAPTPTIAATNPPRGRPTAVAPARAGVDDAARATAQREREQARALALAEREASRRDAEAALAAARATLADADAAVAQAERDLATHQAARIDARDRVKKAQRLVEELSFGR